MTGKRLAAALLAGLCLMTTCAVARAGDSAAGDDWRFRLTPYYWLANLSGTIGYAGLSADLASNSGSWPGSATGAFVLDAEAMYQERLGVLAGFTTVNLNKNPSFSLGSANIGLSASIFDLCALYRFGEAVPGRQKFGAALDFFAGARIWDAKLDLSANLMGASASVSQSAAWVDPLVGARIVLGLTERLEFILRGGIGGFGLGSDLTWDASATLAYSFCENARLILGYRALSLRETSGTALGATLDATLYGPVVGLVISF